MKCAREWGDPPLINWGLRSRRNWAALMMKLALRMLEDSMCGGCGHSSFLAHGYEGYGEYRAETVTCHACKALEKATGDREPGQRRYAHDMHEDPPETDDPDDEPTDDEESSE